jgi:hypothetical protein
MKVRNVMANPMQSAATAVRCAVMAGSAFFLLGAPAHAEQQESTAPEANGDEDFVDLFAMAPVTENLLASANGREQVNWLNATATNTAVVTDNHVGDNNVTGSVNVSDSAFQNVSGISMVNFNTGNNSSINAAMSVNLQINYAAPGQ